MKKDNDEDINLNNQVGYMNGKEVYNFFGVGSETIKKWMDYENFPVPILITPKTRLWKCSEIKEWIDEKR